MVVELKRIAIDGLVLMLALARSKFHGQARGVSWNTCRVWNHGVTHRSLFDSLEPGGGDGLRVDKTKLTIGFARC